MSDVNPDCKELTLDYEYKYIEVGGTQFKNYPEQNATLLELSKMNWRQQVQLLRSTTVGAMTVQMDVYNLLRITTISRQKKSCLSLRCMHSQSTDQLSSTIDASRAQTKMGLSLRLVVGQLCNVELTYLRRRIWLNSWTKREEWIC